MESDQSHNPLQAPLEQPSGIHTGTTTLEFTQTGSYGDSSDYRQRATSHRVYPQLPTSLASSSSLALGCDYVLLCVEALSQWKKLGHVVLPSAKPERMDGNFFRNLKAQYYQIRPQLYVLFTFRDILCFKFVRVSALFQYFVVVSD